MRYYLIYMERYFPQLKIKYKNTIERKDIITALKVINEVHNNRFLTSKQKDSILNQLKSI